MLRCSATALYACCLLQEWNAECDREGIKTWDVNIIKGKGKGSGGTTPRPALTMHHRCSTNADARFK